MWLFAIVVSAQLNVGDTKLNKMNGIAGKQLLALELAGRLIERAFTILVS